MALRRTSYRPSVTLMVLSCLLSVVHAQAQENRNVARVVVWQAKQGMVRDLEEGYKRHLGWHRHNGDSWTWHGWTIISGERFGYFIDGTFFHRWSELDSPVSPGADAADNAENVFPYGDVRSAAIYEGIPQVTNLDSKDLMSPLLTFCYFDVEPARNAEAAYDPVQCRGNDNAFDDERDACSHQQMRGVLNERLPGHRERKRNRLQCEDI